MTKILLTILGQPASIKNRRELATIGPKDNRRTILRKSDEALEYESSALRQIPPLLRVRLEGPVRVTMTIYYANQLSDLDEMLILDCMQDRWQPAKKRDGVEITPRTLVQRGVYRNDRQVKEKHIFWQLDPANPRAVIEIEAMQPQQQALLEEEPPEPVKPAKPSRRPKGPALPVKQLVGALAHDDGMAF